MQHVFGVPGTKIDTVFDALLALLIKTVVCRHEQSAAFIAGGVGRAGVAIVTSGPGMSNLTTGLATANSEGDPIVALGGAVANADGLKQLHQTMDSFSIIKPGTKFSASVGAAHTVAEVCSAFCWWALHPFDYERCYATQDCGLAMVPAASMVKSAGVAMMMRGVSRTRRRCNDFGRPGVVAPA